MGGLEAILYREAKIRLTNLTYMFFDLFYPLAYFLLFGIMMNYALATPLVSLGVNYKAFFLPGVLGMACFTIATNTAWGFFVDRDNGIFYEMLTYPLSRAQFLVGKVSFNIFLAVIQALLTVGLAAVLLGVELRVELLPLLFVGVVLGTSGWFFFFAIFALRIRRNDIFNTITNVFYFIFLFCSSIFYPLEPLPEWFRTAALANPLTWQVDLLRYSSIGLRTDYLVAECAGFIVFSLVAFWFGVRALNRAA